MRTWIRVLASASLSLLPFVSSAYDAVDIALEALERGANYSEAAGAGQDSFDCSGLTHYAYAYVGVQLPKASWEQALVGDRVTLNVNDIGALKRGDLLFFANDAVRLAARTVGHVGIYIGDGKFVHSELYRNGVRVDDISVEGFYRTHFLEARRLQAPPGTSRKFSVGDQVAASESDINVRGLGQGNVRADWLGEVLASGRNGKTSAGLLGQVVDARPVFLNGLWYWRVDFASGDDGWVAETYLTAYGSPAVNSASCTAPIVGQSMTCRVTGTDLPTTVSFTASNCSPSPMTAVAGGTGSERQFTCVPIIAGALVQVSYVVPNFIGPLPVIEAAIAAPSSTEFFSDSFNRANSSSLGNGWTEDSFYSSGGVLFPVDGASIQSNRLRLSHDLPGRNVDAAVYRPLSRSCGVVVTGTVEWTTNFGAGLALFLNTSRGQYTGLQVLFAPALNSAPLIYLFHERTQSAAAVPFAFSLATLYRFEWAVQQDCATEVRIWRASASRPSTPTATSPRVSLASRAEPLFGIMAAGGSGCCTYPGYDVRVDDIRVEELR